ncbi:N-acetylmuramoyl-L-alanine amidase [Streptomyces sp. NPDC004647]|uniref:N-acetylmuramoyl-L-alanine amidase n=1 Tax=Streptomyces sp. NPDC004647 TaxID=3154671 RepID=UPI0033B1D813
MSNGCPPPTPRRPSGRALLIAFAALIPICFSGWLIWQAIGGTEDESAKAPSPLPAGQSSSRSPDGKTGQPENPGAPGGSESSDHGDGKPDGKGDGGNSGDGDGGSGTHHRSGPLSGKVVVVDPGHNPGNRDHTSEIARQVDIGTNRKECDTTGTSTNDGYTEAAFTLDVSRRLRTLLEKEGATVKFTQDDDRPYGPCIDERARIGNKAKADAVVSIHADGSASGNQGFHVILPSKVKGGAADTAEIVGPSRELGERIAGNFVRETGSEPSNYIGDSTGLDVRSDLGGLNLSTVPKVFIECGNMRDREDADRLTNGKWRQRAAQGLADGIQSFLKG